MPWIRSFNRGRRVSSFCRDSVNDSDDSPADGVTGDLSLVDICLCLSRLSLSLRARFNENILQRVACVFHLVQHLGDVFEVCQILLTQPLRPLPLPELAKDSRRKYTEHDQDRNHKGGKSKERFVFR